MERIEPSRPCGPRAWRASTKTGWNWTIGAALYPPLPPTSPTLPPIAPAPDRAPRSFQKKEPKPREPGTPSLPPPHRGARAHEPAGGIYLKTLAVRATGDGERRRMQRRVCHERAAFRPRRRSNRLLPPPLCCLLTRWSPLLSTARRRRLELTPRGALGGGVELLA